jgi:hypothetical protein
MRGNKKKQDSNQLTRVIPLTDKLYWLERGKDLPDEERRKMAAQVALSFAAQLGL